MQMLDEIFKQRPIARFWFLETVARWAARLHSRSGGAISAATGSPLVKLLPGGDESNYSRGLTRCCGPVRGFSACRMPYFSYISMLHLYETLGWWSVGADVRKIHFAEVRR